MPENTGDITVLLQRRRDRDYSAEGGLFTRVLPYLQLAPCRRKRERKPHSFQPTALIGQAYLRIISAKGWDWRNRQHFFAIAATPMLRQLIDHARARPSAALVPLEAIGDLVPADRSTMETGIAVDRLRNKLAETQPKWCTLVERKYFLGLTDEQAADALGLKLRTLERMWRDARQWLFKHREGAHAWQSAG